MNHKCGIHKLGNYLHAHLQVVLGCYYLHVIISTLCITISFVDMISQIFVYKNIEKYSLIDNY